MEAGDEPAWPEDQAAADASSRHADATRTGLALCRKTGRTIPSLDYYLAFGLFRLAVIAQQIYYRFFHGQTQVPEFGSFGAIVRLLEKRTAGSDRVAAGELLLPADMKHPTCFIYSQRRFGLAYCPVPLQITIPPSVLPVPAACNRWR